ncbi:hypothetical protein LPJ73_002548 [Coemansia sp. RSA 2703]|nr:hypothetical protein LPJ73_002548 [Coemansia sp. RSA 2703]KAJ2389077.1 hypothetical protein GGI05_003607 [Coemansia sp. RSA 2603]
MLQEPDNVHSRRAVETAIVVLHLRTTTQIDELMRYASVEIQQRWEYLGPSVDKSSGRQPAGMLFKQIDDALQWQSDDIGEYIRHEHFALELTEEQKDVLCPENVAFEYIDYQTLHAYVPFGHGSTGGTMAVDLVWEGEDKRWAYFNVRLFEAATAKELVKSEKYPLLAATVVKALQNFESHKTLKAEESGKIGREDNDDDDDYWSQFVQPEQPTPASTKTNNGTAKKNTASGSDNGSDNDYWGQYDDDGGSSADGENDHAAELEPKGLLVAGSETQGRLCDEQQGAILQSVELSLQAAAVASQASGVLEAEFLQMAYQQFHAAKRQ